MIDLYFLRTSLPTRLSLNYPKFLFFRKSIAKKSFSYFFNSVVTFSVSIIHSRRFYPISIKVSMNAISICIFGEVQKVKANISLCHYLFEDLIIKLYLLFRLHRPNYFLGMPIFFSLFSFSWFWFGSSLFSSFCDYLLFLHLDFLFTSPPSIYFFIIFNYIQSVNKAIYLSLVKSI